MIDLTKIGTATGVAAGPAGMKPGGDVGQSTGLSGMTPENRTNIPAVDPFGRAGMTPEMSVKNQASQSSGGGAAKPFGVTSPSAAKFASNAWNALGWGR